MDGLMILTILLGSLKLISGQRGLHCIQCTHVKMNRTLMFPNAQSLYHILQSKYNLACSLKNPYDRAELAYRQQIEQEQGSYIVNNNVVSDTICKDPDRYGNPYDTFKCIYASGVAQVLLKHYQNQRINLEMYVRGCMQFEPTYVPGNVCEDTNEKVLTQQQALLNWLQDKLATIGDVVVERFNGWQCFCDTDQCMPIISGSQRTSGYVTGLVLGLVMAILL